tara:strand:+ start:8602 stop:9045 length:444 start_codon:yes stop_codon:yes gene_type:complete
MKPINMTEIEEAEAIAEDMRFRRMSFKAVNCEGFPMLTKTSLRLVIVFTNEAAGDPKQMFSICPDEFAACSGVTLFTVQKSLKQLEDLKLIFPRDDQGDGKRHYSFAMLGPEEMEAFEVHMKRIWPEETYAECFMSEIPADDQGGRA